VAKLGLDVRVVGVPSRRGLLTLPAERAASIHDALGEVDASYPHAISLTAPASEAALAPPGRPRVGVIGNAALLYTPQLNRHLLARIEEEGCVACLPPLSELLITRAPLERFAERFAEQGIFDIICVQSFGCLNGHIHGRGAARLVKQRYPRMNISFIDYDFGASEVNQESRLRLALSIAREGMNTRAPQELVGVAARV
jgi:hypothetical protein